MVGVLVVAGSVAPLSTVVAKAKARPNLKCVAGCMVVARSSNAQTTVVNLGRLANSYNQLKLAGAPGVPRLRLELWLTKPLGRRFFAPL